MRVLREQERQCGRTRAGQAEPEQRLVDRHVVDLGVAAVPVLDLQPLTQVVADAAVDESLTAGVEPGLVVQCPDENVQALAEGVVAEVIEPRTLDGGRHQLAR